MYGTAISLYYFMKENWCQKHVDVRIIWSSIIELMGLTNSSSIIELQITFVCGELDTSSLTCPILIAKPKIIGTWGAHYRCEE